MVRMWTPHVKMSMVYRAPLCMAAQYGTLEVVKYWIEGCVVICRDKYGDAALIGAALGDKQDTVKYLISEQDCDPICRGCSSSPGNNIYIE